MKFGAVGGTNAAIRVSVVSSRRTRRSARSLGLFAQVSVRADAGKTWTAIENLICRRSTESRLQGK
jgi:hypothetical protein